MPADLTRSEIKHYIHERQRDTLKGVFSVLALHTIKWMLAINAVPKHPLKWGQKEVK